MRCREWLARCSPGLLAIPFLVATAQAQSLRITDVRLGAQRDLQFSYASDTNSYYILQQGNSVTNISTPIQLKLGTNGEAQFITPATSAASFYRLRKVPVAQPLDTDGDGLDDLFELRNAPVLNPLNAADGGLTTISSSSPMNGEK